MQLKQLKVIKADGSVEQYLHTKVLGSFSNALDLIGESNVFAAEQFAEAVTFHLYNNHTASSITSEQIHLMVQAVLNSTGFENAAREFGEFHLNRKMRRKRIEVVNDLNGDGEDENAGRRRELWDKSVIVLDLLNKGFEREMARAIASSVEQKVLNIGMLRIRRGLLKELVIGETEAMLEAEKQLLLYV